MKIKIILFFFSMSLLFFNCTSAKLDFTVCNKTNENITGIQIMTTNEESKTSIFNVSENNCESLKLDFKNVSKTDGSYTIVFKRNNKMEKRSFGYFTNGYPLDRIIGIAIYADSIAIQSGC